MHKKIVLTVSILFLSLFLYTQYCIHAAYAASTDITDMQYYMTKYGFFQPQAPATIPPATLQRLANLKPIAILAAQKYNARYQMNVEPELMVWWSYAEGIGGNINYSNCANEVPATGSYFTDIKNCDTPSFWQLGAFGNQFAFIAYFYGATVETTVSPLKNAFLDMHGDPNNAALVQQVGQAVLDFDKTQNTIPTCGGSSCTFPSMTIDQIMSDVHCGYNPCTGSQETQNNWWAAVLMRDPGINAYIQARGLWGFNRDQTISWPGCYYAAPCWQNESNKMGDLLAVWNTLPACTGPFCANASTTSVPVPTPTPLVQDNLSMGVSLALVVIVGFFLIVFLQNV